MTIKVTIFTHCLRVSPPWFGSNFDMYLRSCSARFRPVREDVTFVTSSRRLCPGCTSFNTLRPRQNGCHFPDDIFICIFLNETVWITINISLKSVPKGQINNISAMFQIMACNRPGDKPLSEPMMVIFLMHICITRPQWVNFTLHCIPHDNVNMKTSWYGNAFVITDIFRWRFPLAKDQRC